MNLMQSSGKNMKLYKKVAYIGVFLSLAIILSYIELILGFNALMPIYGIKLGLYNIAVIIAMFSLGFIEAFLIIVLRSIIMSVLFGSVTSFAFSILGGVAAFIIMTVLIKSRLFGKYISIIGVSVAGASFFNFGQIIASVILTGQLSMFYYLPVLLIGSVFTGTIIGITSRIILKYLKYNRLF